MYELIDKIIKSNNLDRAEVLDLCYAICIADMIYGSNKLELNTTRFLSANGTELEWASFISSLGVEPNNSDKMPKVQRFRVVTDALVIACCKKDKSLARSKFVQLTSEASSRVAHRLEISLGNSDYADYNELKPILQALCVQTQDLTCVYELEDLIKGYEEQFYGSDFDLRKFVRDTWKGIQLPDEFSFIQNGKCKLEDVDEIITYLRDMLIYGLEVEILRCIQLDVAGDILRTVYMLNKFMATNPGVVFGTCSFSNNAPVLDTKMSVKRQVKEKLAVLFSGGMNYDIQDLDKVMLLLRMLYRSKEYI